MSSNEKDVQSQLVMDASEFDGKVKSVFLQRAVEEEPIDESSAINLETISTGLTITNEVIDTAELPASSNEIKDAAAIKIEEIANQNESPEESLKQITNAQQQLSTVKTELLNIIDAFSKNQSYVTQAANFWGGLSLTQKIAGGVIVVGPTMAAGIALNIGALITISSVSGATYLVSGVLFEDHHKCNKNTLDNVKAVVISLTQFLESTIEALENIRLKFAREIERFKIENEKLINHVKELGNQMITLGNEVLSMTVTTKHLLVIKEDLETMTQNQAKKLEEKDIEVTQNQNELHEVKRDCERSQKLLAEKVQELDEVKQSFQLEVDKATVLGEVLRGTVNTMADAVLKNGDQQAQFKAKMDDFLADKEKSFHLVTDRVCSAERELKKVKDELKEVTESHKDLMNYHKYLLEEQKNQIGRLEQIQNVNGNNKEPLAPIINEGLKSFGMFANKAAVVPVALVVNNTTNANIN